MKRAPLRTKIAAFVLLVSLSNVNAQTPGELHVKSPDWREQIIYFVMLDRFNDGNPGNNDQGVGEFDPARNSHYSGGDLPGVTEKLSYIKNLGATAVWITPPVANQWWSATAQYSGYHGYWAENLMAVDKHYGQLSDLQNLSRRLHGQGMYLVQDIVVNHMGNYFSYDPKRWSAQNPALGYRREPATAQGQSPSQMPFSRNDARDPRQAREAIYHWTPDIRDFTDPAQEHDWQMAGLDDLNTENPRVREALRRSYGHWIREAGVDAFRVDTAFYVPPDYFRDFLYAEDPAQPGILRVAEATGRANFHVFGEGFGIDKPYQEIQSRKIESFVRSADGQALMPAMINFPLYGTGIDIFAKGHPTREMRHRIETMMRVHESPHLMPSFVDNHDVDRFLANGSTAALQQNLLMIMTLPGIPVIYYGTEQGFTEQRGAMFKAGFGSGGKDRFDERAPLYRSLQAMTSLRKSNPVFTHGMPTVLKDNAAGPGVFAYRMRHDGADALVLFNTADSPHVLDNLDTGRPDMPRWRTAFSLTPFPESLGADAQGRVSVVLPARAGLVLLPETRVAALPKHPAALRIDALPETIEGDALDLRGRNSNAEPFQLAVNGDLSQAVTVTPSADGRWQAQLPIDALAEAREAHQVLAWQDSTASASEPQSFRVRRNWQTLLERTDPRDDDHGRSGTLRYPDDISWGEHRQGDIESVRVQRAGSTLRIVLQLRGMTQFWNPPNGFDHVAVTAFLQMTGREGGSTLMPQQNGSLPDGMRWHYRLRTHGWSNAWFGPEGATADNEGTVLSPGAQVVADAQARTLTFTIPAKALGNPASLSGIKLYLNTWDYDGGYRALSPQGGGMVFGGDRADGVKVLDETGVLVLP
ncbi:alpha-amylase family glycosyl hydrolase [Arenimonas sp. GDDSR-1]|uniref:alpha-amylase family glycosyl hydrolase n=1 Tax=Arenimonas sp. GDDSR-1 TaxID=2950125 RepID=UPI002616D635|nr:alpha-amylase family glycosyl hydrolase [Arenimonas sp. GDDSR-1]